MTTASSMSARATIRELLSEHVSELPGDDDPLDLDSLTIVTVIEALEDRFGIRVAPREVTKDSFGSVASLSAFIEAKLR